MQLESCPRCCHEQVFPERRSIQCDNCLAVVVWAVTQVPGQPERIQPVTMPPREYAMRLATALSADTRWGRQPVPTA